MSFKIAKAATNLFIFEDNILDIGGCVFEVEIKARCNYLDNMLALLLNKGAKPMGGREQRDTYFAHSMQGLRQYR